MSIEDKDLDVYDKKILMELIQAKTEIGFLKLLKALQEPSKKFTKPTLINHLNSLEKRKYIKKRRGKTKKTSWKPSYYSVNYELIDKFIPIIYPDFEKLPGFTVIEGIKDAIEKLDFESLSINALQYIYIGDLQLVKLYIEGLRQKNKDNVELQISKDIMSLTVDIMMQQLRKVSLKMKDEDFQVILSWFDRQIKIIEEYIKTGKFEGDNS